MGLDEILKSKKTQEASTALDDEDEGGQSQAQAAEEVKPVLSHETYQDLMAQLNAMETKANTFEDQAMRIRAEMDNLQRRTQQEIQKSHKFALEKFARALLPVADSLEKGLETVQAENEALKDYRAGLELTLKMLLDEFEKFGINQLNPVNEPFNADLHEAMAAQPDAKLPPYTIIAVLQKGYKLHDRLLRPARVIVTRD